MLTYVTSPDAMALRALAHPLRWELIDLLFREEAATATRCAQVLGESVASCSYHLGILGKYGYAELVPDQPGREKPWRLTSPNQDLSPASDDPESIQAALAASDAFLDHELARTKHRLRGLVHEPAEWQEASRLLGTTTWMTADELHAVSDALVQAARVHADRVSDPSARPPDAREVRVFLSALLASPTPPPEPERRDR
jgi:hypothetical protein